MAEKNTYPIMSVKNWWLIRKKFRQTLPGTVTATYISTVLDMQEVSTKNNVLPFLKQFGIIDQDGKTTDLAKMWRDDQDYPQACDTIKNSIYPQELLDIPANSQEDRDAVKRWFSRTTGVGESTSNKMTAFYLLLCEKDVSKESEFIESNNGSKNTKPQPKTPKEKNNAKPEIVAPNSSNGSNMMPYPNKNEVMKTTMNPSININLQIHISSDATSEQIDKIFESMAKHIFNQSRELNG